jgi:hypothetical protein
MKKNLLLIIVLGLASLFRAGAQSEESIIFLNFQDWEASPGVQYDPPDSCEVSRNLILKGPDQVMIDYQTGGHGEVTLWKYWVSPLCNCKHMNRDDTPCGIDITTGWVSLAKQSTPEDTVGQFILPKLSNVTKIEVGFSCTGEGRGLRIYASTDDGATWGDPIGGEHLDGNQDGVFATEVINMDNVILKITSGVDGSDASQFARVHNVQVWGVPGGPETGITESKTLAARAFYRPGEGLIIQGQLSQIQIFDITGRMVGRSLVNGSQTLDVSSFSKGIYILKAMDRNDQVFTQKFVIK